ncbi:25565_t:CDS:2, partial [Gigaspora rosea]
MISTRDIKNIPYFIGEDYKIAMVSLNVGDEIKAERKFVALRVSTVMKLFGTSVEECARNILFPVLSPDIDEGGKYFDCGVEAKVNSQALDQELTNEFWNISEKLVNKYYINNDNVENELNLPEGTEHKVMKTKK